MKNPHLRVPVLALSLLAGAALMTGCDRPEGANGQRGSDRTGSSAERSGGAGTGSLSSGTGGSAESGRSGTGGTSGTGSAGTSAREAGRDAGQAIGNAADAVANKSKDMAITAAVNARLAGDERLSALSINVDTVGGRVVLRGSAPDTAARAHAAELARAVDGVTEVNNELSVQPAR